MTERYYSIGEVSKLMNISIKALRHYDKIGLFKPAYIDPNTNYRYYDDSQLYLLDLIKSLKYIGIPLKEIKEVQEFNADDLLVFLKEQERVVKDKIDNLMQIEQTITSAKKGIQRIKEYPTIGEVFFSNEEETQIIQTGADGINPTNILNASFQKLKQITASTEGFRYNDYGAIFPYRSYTCAEEVSYKYLFTPVLSNEDTLELSKDTEIRTIPRGKYVCIAFYSLSEQDYFTNLKKLLQYVEDNRLTVISDIYESLVNLHYSSNREKGILMEMRMRIEEE
ncbi:MerR family transcriptional regulator [Ornithinibacillus bavariensis]|uniref:MerR family transcriptional regulator n=1 Tax=Ornithinibacillus bavariensis TaxID=545502 RepID=UPI000ECFF1FD|nr:MerR family transcriptional regulator [Ornithinibacillus sp.]